MVQRENINIYYLILSVLPPMEILLKVSLYGKK